MEMTATVKIILAEMVESAGESGISEGEVAAALAKYGFGYYETLDVLKSACKELPGIERTPEHIGQLIYYRKAKQQKQPEESAAERIARKSAQRTTGEKQRMNILNNYRK